MDAKALYFDALAWFLERNSNVLPQLQLQYGRNERWFARELALAMNAHLSGGWGAHALPLYADCEVGYGDISVWSHGARTGWAPQAVYEIKVLYSDDFDLQKGSIEYSTAVVEKAWTQLRDTRVPAERRIGLFFVVHASREPNPASIAQLKTGARNAIRSWFTSDHDIRLTSLCPLTQIAFGEAGAEPWFTESWATWGVPLEK